ncbi:Transposase zinc-ribbon domain protein [compost metagenome]
MAKKEALTLIQFQKAFQTEEACHEHLYKMKWPDGFCCPRCSGRKSYEVTTRRLPLYECVQCGHQTAVTAGTVLEKTRTDLVKWFWAIFLIAHDKRGISAEYLSTELLGVAYQTAWTMGHKIRKAMGDHDASYTLEGNVELDDPFFGAPTEGGKRGRGTDQTPVLVALSLDKKG